MQTTAEAQKHHNVCADTQVKTWCPFFVCEFLCCLAPIVYNFAFTQNLKRQRQRKNILVSRVSFWFKCKVWTLISPQGLGVDYIFMSFRAGEKRELRNLSNRKRYAQLTSLCQYDKRGWDFFSAVEMTIFCCGKWGLEKVCFSGWQMMYADI